MEDMLIGDVGLAASIQRPEPPYELDDEEAVEWRRIVNSMPADHFIPANYHMLTLLCQSIVERRKLQVLGRSYRGKKQNVDVRVYLDLSKQIDRLSMTINTLSRSCRITHQSTFNPDVVKLKKAAARTIDMSEEKAW